MQRTTTEKIEKFISEYQTKIDRCYYNIKGLKAEQKTNKLESEKESNVTKKGELDSYGEYLKRSIAVQEKKKDILVQAKSDFECCL